MFSSFSVPINFTIGPSVSAFTIVPSPSFLEFISLTYPHAIEKNGGLRSINVHNNPRYHNSTIEKVHLNFRSSTAIVLSALLGNQRSSQPLEHLNDWVTDKRTTSRTNLRRVLNFIIKCVSLLLEVLSKWSVDGSHLSEEHTSPTFSSFTFCFISWITSFTATSWHLSSS